MVVITQNAQILSKKLAGNRRSVHSPPEWPPCRKVPNRHLYIATHKANTIIIIVRYGNCCQRAMARYSATHKANTTTAAYPHVHRKLTGSETPHFRVHQGVKPVQGSRQGCQGRGTARGCWGMKCTSGQVADPQAPPLSSPCVETATAAALRGGCQRRAPPAPSAVSAGDRGGICT